MKKALCVGLNKFALPGNNLAGCVNDAASMKAVLEGLGCEVRRLADAQATKAGALATLTELVQEARGGKLTYLGFSWSGHGTHYSRPEETDGLGEALVCYDCREKGGGWDVDTIIKDWELRDLLNSVPDTCTVEVWMDTCYSGGMDRAWADKWNVTAPRYIHNPGNGEGLTRLANSSVSQGLNSNIVMWCASSEPETSMDAFVDGRAQGAFTAAWCKAYNRNRQVSRVELLLKSRRWLLENRYSQFPRLKCWNRPAQMKVGG